MWQRSVGNSVKTEKTGLEYWLYQRGSKRFRFRCENEAKFEGASMKSLELW